MCHTNKPSCPACSATNLTRSKKRIQLVERAMAARLRPANPDGLKTHDDWRLTSSNSQKCGDIYEKRGAKGSTFSC